VEGNAVVMSVPRAIAYCRHVKYFRIAPKPAGLLIPFAPKVKADAS
jgi:hypothetical protein